MPIRQNILASLSPYQGKSTVLVQEHDVDDIIKALRDKHRKYSPDYDKFSQFFWQNNAHDTARALYNYLHKKVEYKIEPDTDQTVRSPQAILAIGSGDCKHYAQFITGVLASLRRKGYNIGQVRYRYAGYNPFADDLHHVFAVLQDGNRELWIDPVLPYFNDRKKYFVHQDQIAGIMPLREISGIYDTDNDSVGNLWDDIKKGVKNTVKKVENTVQRGATDVQKGAQNTVKKVSKGAQVNLTNLAKGVKITAKNVSTGAQNTFDKTKKVVLKANPLSVVARNAFLAINKANGFNMAHRLYDYIHSSKANEQEVMQKWQSIGGEWNKLKTAITQGMQSYAVRHKMSLADYNKKNKFINGIQPMHPVLVKYWEIKCTEYPYYMPGISDQSSKKMVGVDPITLASLMTAAATVIALFMGILRKAKWSAQDQASAEAAIDSGAQLLSNAAAMTPDGGGYLETGMVQVQDGNYISTLAADVTDDPYGNKQVTLYQTGALDPNYQYQGANDPNIVDNSFTGNIRTFFAEIEDFWTYNKKPILITGGLVLAWKAGVFKSTHKITKRGK